MILFLLGLLYRNVECLRDILNLKLKSFLGNFSSENNVQLARFKIEKCKFHMMNYLDIKDTLHHEYCSAKLSKIPKDLYKRNILFYLDNEKISGTIVLGSLSSIPCFTVSSIAMSNKFNLSKPFPHLAKE